MLLVASPRSLTGALCFGVAAWLIGASVIDVMKRGKGMRAGAWLPRWRMRGSASP